MKRTVACLALLSAFALRAEEPIRFEASLDAVEQDGYRFRRLARPATSGTEDQLR